MVSERAQRLLESIRSKRAQTDPKTSWQRYWREEFPFSRVIREGKEYDVFDNWISGREIRVFRMPGVDEGTVGPIIDGVNDLIREIGLADFLIDISQDYWGPHESAVTQVRQATRRDGRLDGHELGMILLAEGWRDPTRGGTPHADIIITDQHLVLGNENWGQSEFSNGYAILSVPGVRQNELEFLRSIAKHEAGHLFGYHQHHDSSDEIAGYSEPPDCNMFWRASTLYLCEKCRDALLNIWRGIQERTGQMFLR